ncbi:ankyrin repeat domain-containing protein [Flavitalea sp.]|nr:ankyrin repeat domain-containing protein [Flavitalea sp.]
MLTSKQKIAGMFKPSSLKTDDYLPWSRGRGSDVWKMICAAITGDLSLIKKMVASDPALATCEYEYLQPIHFAVRENHLQVVQFLLAHGASIANESQDSLIKIATDRDYHDMISFIETELFRQYHIQPEGETVAAAIKSFDKEEVRSLIDKEPSLVHAADQNGNQPIHWAALTRQIDMIDYLLEKGADVNARRPDGARPIDLTNGDYNYRSWYRDLPGTGLQKHEVVVGYLIARGGYCDISVAAKIGYYDRVRELLKEDTGLVNRLPSYVGYYSGLPLRCAAGAGFMEIVKLLLENGANPNEPEPGIAPDGGALHAAIGAKHFDIVKLLLEKGADADAEIESSGNCLFIAEWVKAPKEVIDLIASYSRKTNRFDKGRLKITVEALAEKLDDNPYMELNHLVHDFINEEMREHVELVLRYQPDALKLLNFDQQAWYDHATAKSSGYARWLFERGFSPNRRNWLGITLLHRCAAKGDKEVAAVCLEFGGDINAVETEWSSTPLGWAAKEGNIEMVHWFLQRGADPQLPVDEPWARPIAWALRRGHSAIVRLLE